MAFDGFAKFLVPGPVFHLVNLATVVFETATATVAPHQFTATLRVPRDTTARKSTMPIHVHERSTQERFLHRWETGYFSVDKIIADRFNVVEVV